MDKLHAGRRPPPRLLIFVGQGGLGNQVFQLVALHKLFPETRLVGLSLSRCLRIFAGSSRHVVFLQLNAYLERGARVLLSPILRIVSQRCKLLHYVRECSVLTGGRAEYTGEILWQKGLLPFAFAEKIFSQNFNGSLTPSDFSWLEINQNLRATAVSTLQRNNINLGDAIGVHIRRADYLAFESYGQTGIALTISYFRDAIHRVRGLLGGGGDIVVFSDDIPWAKSSLQGLISAFFISESEAIDFACLSMFSALVISNSTFSLSAGLVSRRCGLIVAPKYWFGWRSSTWAPPGIEIRGDLRIHYLTPREELDVK